MSTIEWVFGIILAIFAIAIIIVVLLQEGHQKDLGTVTGGADTFFDKNQARSIDAFLGPVDQGYRGWLFYFGNRD